MFVRTGLCPGYMMANSVIIFTALLLVITKAQLITDINTATQWLDEYNIRVQEEYYQVILAAWNYNTNITDYNQQKSVEAVVNESVFSKEAAHNASLFDWKNFEDEYVRRQFKKLAVIGDSKLPLDKIKKVENLISTMEATYSKGKVCNKPGEPSSDKCYNLSPDLTRIFTSSRDWDELLWAWKGWRDATGKQMKDMYEEFIALQNEAAVLNGFPDKGALYRDWYEMDGFEAEVARLWEQVKPLYQQLHSYVRRKLQKTYQGHDFPSTGHIPAHILSNMWAQEWVGLSDIMLPFPNKPGIDVTDAMVDQGYNATMMMQLAEDFFVSLGLKPMPASFWEHSMFERPDDREVVCHASAWDFYNQKDFRIKQCTDITMDWLVTSHHEMGHVQYYLQYKHLPLVFRRGANPGFHEAVGDVMSLSVSTPEHLHEIGLLHHLVDDTETDLNYLMAQALTRIAFLPFGYLIDQWRWSVFDGRTPKDQYNAQWWNLRCKLQGVSPPVPRSEEDFDPGAKYHIPANTPYIRYFVSFVLQFQLHRELCLEANNTRALHRCDIYNSKAAGKKLGDMLKLGASKKWPEALKQVTGSETLDASAIIEYFQPLYDWLVEHNKGHSITWDEKCPEGSIVISSAPKCTITTFLYSIVAMATYYVTYHHIKQ